MKDSAIYYKKPPKPETSRAAAEETG